jgi:hypothetical protein
MNRIYALIFLGVAAAVIPAHAPGCGGEVEVLAFFPENEPNVPPDDFVAGRLGVVRPEIWIRHLAIAYRYLAGKPLRGEAKVNYGNPPTGDPGYISPDAWKRWLDVRAKIAPGAPPREPSRHRVPPGSCCGEHPNCSTGTVESATEILERRLASFGATHAGMRSWVAAQDIVFDNCTSGTAAPPDPEPDLPPILAADRRHQIAAAHFYAGRLDEAREGWLRAAADERSPWRERAGYFAARCLIRKSTLRPEDFYEPLMRQAAEELETIGSHSGDATVRDWAASLAAYARGRVEPYGTMARLGSQISDPERDERFFANVDEFDYVYVTRSSKLSPRGADDFTDWILAARKKMPAAEVIARWKRTHSLPWLVWALAAIEPRSADCAELLRAASAIPSDSRAFATAVFHRVRLAMADGDRDAARTLLDTALPELRSGQPVTALNPFLAWRLAVARDYNEFLRYAVRQELELLPSQPPDGFDTDVTSAFNRHLPRTLWNQALNSQVLPQALTQSIRRTLWVRAVLSGDHELARALSPEIRKAHPDLQANLLAFENASSPAEREFAAAYALMKANLEPVLEPGQPYYWSAEDGRADWCSVDEGDQLQEAQTPPAWLSAADRQRAAAELSRMRAQGTASDFFARAAISWAKTHPRDPRSPEALHLTVRSTRNGCHDSDTGDYSRAAFVLLHKQYPNSKWARRTKYWFSGPLR